MSRKDWIAVAWWFAFFSLAALALLCIGLVLTGCAYDPISNNSTWREKQRSVGTPQPTNDHFRPHE